MTPPTVNTSVWRRSLRPDAGRYGDAQQTGTVLAVVPHKEAAFGWVALIHWHGQRVGAFSAHEGIEFSDQTGGVRIWVA